MKTLHFDCFAGISGDMTLGALVDLGVEADYVRSELQKLPVEGWTLDFCRDERCGITGIKAVVTVGNTKSRHEHNHEHHHEHNYWKDIRRLIKESDIREGAKNRALDIFTRIAEAEATVHGVPVDEVAFHEVGALDSIVDIVGAAICLDMLAPDRITSSAIELGGGFVTCEHGVLPVPAPATLKICTGLPVTTGGFNKEMTTPTGAAILASCVDEFITCGWFMELKTAYGIGMRKLDKPNVLRVSWREEEALGKGSLLRSESLIQLESALDDMTGEALGFLMDRLFDAGALDVTFTPCTMKKSRPGIIVTALCGEKVLTAVRETFFVHSSTLGFREFRVDRLSLPRTEEQKESPLGIVHVKTAFLGGKPMRSKIEFDDRARLARENNITLEQAERRIRGEEPGNGK
ncbi:MAG: nickel pincer cofactor biosynthesis protein LarC [Treponema sp.]|jgi:uncharacterized protein (TIGR00299 family) protein|nr:nickel pincer cofactor biosynthesis protein LarC [Treponema sp.]